MFDRVEIANLVRVALATLAVGAFAGCGDDEEDDDAATACAPGQQVGCVCTDGSNGAQACNAAGTGFEACVCTGVDDVAETDSGIDDAGSDSNAPDTTGTDSVETDTTDDVGADDAAPDAADVAEDTVAVDAEGSDVVEDVAPPAPIYVARVASVALPWQHMGLSGYDAGVSLCQTAAESAGHSNPSSVAVCEYTQVLAADAAGEFVEFLVGDEAWLHRTTVAMVDGAESAPGPGGRCNDWYCSACDHISDGEIVIFGDGVVTEYQLDNDTIFDPMAGGVHTQIGRTPCNGQRYILCCNAPTE